MSGVFQSSLWLKHAKSDLRDFMYSWSCNLVSRALLFLTHSMPISFHAESAFPGDKVRIPSKVYGGRFQDCGQC